MQIDAAIGSRRGEESTGESVGLAEQGRLQHAHGLGEVDGVEDVARHGAEREGVAARHGLIEARRAAVAGGQSAGTQSASRGSAATGAPAGRWAAAAGTTESSGRGAAFNAGPIPKVLLMRRFMLNCEGPVP